jgi:hypothetical protein
MSGISISSTPATVGQAGGRRKGATVKTLKRALKKAGLKVSGKKATLTRRAKKAHLKLKGGVQLEGEKEQGQSSAETAMAEEPVFEEEKKDGGRRRRSRKSRGSRKH